MTGNLSRSAYTHVTFDFFFGIKGHKMTSNRHTIENSLSGIGALGLGVCKQILNRLVEASHRSLDRSRFADLQLRALDDIGLTIAERDALLR
jgi:hypothetical protein